MADITPLSMNESFRSCLRDRKVQLVGKHAPHRPSCTATEDQQDHQQLLGLTSASMLLAALALSC